VLIDGARARAASVLVTLVALGCGAPARPERFTNSLGMTMVLVTPPSSPGPGEPTAPYYLSTTEVTNAQLEALDKAHARRRAKESPGDDHPATNVSYDDAAMFVSMLARREGRFYALPTEAEWQWAAQGGARRMRYATEDGTLGHDLANYAGEDGRDRFAGAAPVGSFPPNPLGFHDMSGNVWEWCASWYDPKPHAHRVHAWSAFFPGVRIPGFWYGTMHDMRVLRGGSFVHDEPLMRIDVRNAYRPGHRSPSYGFRVALPAAGTL
jgi:formylglycine-generating enzyme required for sulfatase activity